MKKYGTLTLKDGTWLVKCDPHVAIALKRVFGKIDKGASGVLKIANTPTTCVDLEWFLSRYPLEMAAVDHIALARASLEHQGMRDDLESMFDVNYVPPAVNMAVPPRTYQSFAGEFYRRRKMLLLADDVGLGKTCSAICSLTDRDTLPAVIVCPANLTRQWRTEINRFIPSLNVHILKQRSVYNLAELRGGPVDVLVTSYHKLDAWADVLAKLCKSVVFDEAQELRRSGTPREPSKKYEAAKTIAAGVPYKIGLSATPIYNYGGEMFNVLNVLNPGCLGSKEEFHREWCTSGDDKARIKDPKAFGAFLRDQHIMLRRTRKDVGRELEPLQKITQRIDADLTELDKINDAAGELARIILRKTGEGQRGDAMQASEEFNNIMRQATGLAKAPYVAAFVQMLLENGEPVVLFGWHRAVYEIWMAKLADHKPRLYTGSESVAGKAAAVEDFINKKPNLLIVSLRSGAGLDGLQKRCRTVAFGELDWSPAVHEQCVGRVHRDGQKDPVVAYFMLSDYGVDPFIASVLGIKTRQIEGVLALPGSEPLMQRVDDGSSIRRMAESFLKGRHGKVAG